MKIQSIKVENYKSFKDLELENLLPVNMVFGYNNSGKSNLFKFLELIFNAPEISEVIHSERGQESLKVKQNFWDKIIVNQPFIFRRDGSNKHDITFSIVFELDKAEIKNIVSSYENLSTEYLNPSKEIFLIEIEGNIKPLGDYNAQQKLKKVKLEGKVIYDIESDLKFEGSESLNHNDFESLMTVFNNCVLLLDNDRYFIDENESSKNTLIDAKNFKNGIFNMSLSLLKADDLKGLEEFLKTFQIRSRDVVFSQNEKSSPFQNLKFEFTRLGSDKIEVMLTNSFGSFPLSSFGTGVQQIIYILSRIFLGQTTKIVLIEEIELNLSPKYQLELISFIFEKLIRVKGKYIDQLFYTTHSPLMCYRSEFRTLQSRIDNNGISTIQKIVSNAEDVAKFKDAMKILEHYHPPATPRAKSTAASKTKSRVSKSSSKRKSGKTSFKASSKSSKKK